jgi:CubicO group peptidase (beta-lactamase class C family)
MRRASARFWVTLAVGSTLLGSASPTTLAAQTVEDRVGDYLEPFLETGNFQGTILIGRAGEVLLARGYGMADSEAGVANTPETAFQLASVSRVFTSAAVMLLEQQGLLSRDDRLSQHLPDWPRGDEITIHDLLTLSAGFPNINSLPGYGALLRSPQTAGSLARRFRDLPLEFEPGTRSVHSNSNYVVLALLIERVSGRSYGKFLEQELLGPLGMDRTGHREGNPPTSIARGYTPVGLADVGPIPPIEWSAKTGHGSIYASAPDLYLFDRALANGTLFTESSIEGLFTEHFPSNGYGWFVGAPSGRQEVYINGRSPGFGAFWGRLVREDITVIVLTNLYSSVSNRIGRDLMSLVAGGSDVFPPDITAQGPDPALLEELAGSYQFGPDFYRPNGTVRIAIRDGQLFNRSDWVMPTTGDPLHFVHRRYWSDLVFVRDAEGTITELRYDDFVGAKR